MKKLIVALALLASIGTAESGWANQAPKHRYQPKTEQAEALEAYSDTTSTDSAAEDSTWEYEPSQAPHSKFSLSNYDDPFDFVGSVFGKGMLVGLIVLCVVCSLLFFLAPLLIIYFIVRYLMRRHNDRIKLAEMAMEKGINIPERERPIYKQSDEYLVKRGLRNTFLGIGLTLMFMLWQATFLVGIGCLVVFYGLGQTVIGCLPSLKRWWASSHGKNDMND